MKNRATSKAAPAGARRPGKATATRAAAPAVRPAARPRAPRTRPVAPLALGADPVSVIHRLAEGLPTAYLDELAGRLDVPAAELAGAAGIPARTLVRRRVDGRLTPEESERVYRFARLLSRAEQVLGGLDAARKWFKSVHPALPARTPLQFAASELGAHEVEQLLGRLEQGVF